MRDSVARCRIFVGPFTVIAATLILASTADARLIIRGPRADDLARMIAKCACVEAVVGASGNVSISEPLRLPEGCSKTFNSLLKNIIDSRNDVEVTTVHGDDICVDAFNGGGRQSADVEDFEGLPENPAPGHPNATTRCQILIHMLAEAFHGANNAGKPEGNYGPSHDAGKQAENSYREDKGQTGNVVEHGGPAGDLVTDYDDGHQDTYHYSNPAQPPEYR